MKRARSWWQQLTATTKVGYVAIWLYGYGYCSRAGVRGQWVAKWQSGVAQSVVPSGLRLLCDRNAILHVARCDKAATNYQIRKMTTCNKSTKKENTAI